MVNKRIELLDYLRGFALLGIILVNVAGIKLVDLKMPIDNFDAMYASFLSIFIESKFFAIFSTLFGIGFYIFMERAAYKPQNKYLLYIRRLLILYVFGFLHMQLQPGEALNVYAIVGLLLLIFFHLKKEINLIIGVLILIAITVLDVKIFLVLPYFIIGLAIGQYRLPEKLNQNFNLWRIAWCISAVFALISFILLFSFYSYPNYIVAEKAGVYGETYVQGRILFDHLITLTSPFISLFYVLTIVVITQTKFGFKCLSPLKFYGRLALTNYIFQTLLILFYTQCIFKAELSMTHSLIMCLVIYVIQIFFSVMWFKYFTYGPLEYIWRMGTYLKFIKLKRT